MTDTTGMTRMSDVAELARKANEAGFEQGALAMLNMVILHLNGNGFIVAADLVRRQFEADSSAPGPVQPAPVPPAILLPTPAMSRTQARVSGYTGDSCTNCQSMQVKRNGSCLVCEGCGNTTGCS